jgi:hypothetical protein
MNLQELFAYWDAKADDITDQVHTGLSSIQNMWKNRNYKEPPLPNTIRDRAAAYEAGLLRAQKRQGIDPNSPPWSRQQNQDSFEQFMREEKDRPFEGTI